MPGRKKHCLWCTATAWKWKQTGCFHREIRALENKCGNLLGVLFPFHFFKGTVWHQFPWLRWGLGSLQRCILRCLSYFWMFYPHFDERDINSIVKILPFVATLLLCDSIHGPRITKITSKLSCWDYLEYSPICLPNSLFLFVIFRLPLKFL